MSAEVLRKAAALMRERAEAATPGQWFVPRRGFGIDAGEYDTVLGPGPVECMSYCYGGSSTIEGDRLDADQTYIASWHPAVALAVADWLDSEARNEEYALAEFGHRTARPEALAVADAYLGNTT